MTYVGALPPDGFALSEWQVVSESAVPSPFGERRIVVGSGHQLAFCMKVCFFRFSARNLPGSSRPIISR